LLAAVLAPVLFCHAQTNAPIAGGSESVGIIDFEGAPVQAVLDYYARLTKRSIIAAPNLAGVIRFRSQTELTRAEALQALDTVLAMNSVSVIPMGEKFLKVVQTPTAKQEGVRIGIGEPEGLPPSDTFLAQVVKIKYAELTDVTSAVQPLLHSYGAVVPLHQSNCILVIDTANNVLQMVELLKHVDQPYELRLESKVYQLKYAKAADAVQRITTILQNAQQFKPKSGAGAGGAAPAPAPGAPPAPASAAASIETKIILSPDERTNKIFVFSRSKDFTLLDNIISEMDVRVEPDVITKVVELSYANADEAASLVNAIIGGGSGGFSSGTTSRRSTRSSSSRSSGATTGLSRPTVPPSPTPTPAVRTAGGSEPAAFLEYPEGVRILPDMRTNTLLIMATKDDMDRLVQLVKSIDTTVPQVLIEVIIGEVTLANQNDTGVDLVQRVIKAGPAHLFGGTLTGDASGSRPFNVGSFAIGSVPTPQGAAISSALTYWATFRRLNLDAVIRLLASEGKLRVLSTPVIQTLHNQEGSIVVGKSVPVATSTLSDIVSSGTSTNQFASGLRANVEYKDVALELFVTPRVNPDGFVTLEINQKVNELGEDKNIGGIVVPSIRKREAQSVVMVQDQSTVVLGGLIQDSKSRNETKVPVLGDIPLLGWLFKHRKDTIDRDELIVFIRPVVLRTETAATAEGRRRLQMLDSLKELGIEKKLDPAAATNTPPPTVTPPREKATEEPRRGTTPSNLKLGGKKN
jgi:general secretion pathway protein D